MMRGRLGAVLLPLCLVLASTAGARVSHAASARSGSTVMRATTRRPILLHAALISSEPAKNSRLATSPKRIRLVFSEPVEPGVSQFTLTGADGVARRLVVTGDPHDVHALVAPLTGLASGDHRLAWSTLSADGHAIDGSFTFHVVRGDAGADAQGITTADSTSAASGTAAPPDSATRKDSSTAAGSADSSTDSTASRETARSLLAMGGEVDGAPVLPALLRGLGVGALMALAGTLLFLVLPGGAQLPQARAMRRAATALSIAAPILLLLHAAAWAANASPDQQLTAEWVGAMSATDVGHIELLRIALALLAAWAMGLARRPSLALGFACASLLVSGATGHPAAIVPLVAIPMKAAHLLGVSAWLGGLLWLAAYGLQHVSDDTTALLDAAEVRAAHRVSSIALGAVAVVAVSGAVQTWLFLPSLTDVLRSAYGRLVLFKLGGMLALIAFGAYHRFILMPRLRQPGASRILARSVRREVAMMAVVVLAGGVLAYVPPPEATPPGAASSTHDQGTP